MMKRSFTALALVVLLLAGIRIAFAQQALLPEQALEKARVGGKYSTLLRHIEVPQDAQTYGEFSDHGFWSGTEWAGFKNLPQGHWVYVFPNWYIWRDAKGAPGIGAPGSGKRNWGPEQAIGEPDTREAGDLTTAWASLTADGQDEWLVLDYPAAITPVAVLIHETFNPGAVNRITMVRPDTEEVDVWKGKDPTPADRGRGVSVVPVSVDFKTNRIRLHIASKEVPGWNEIDAVGLVDEFGKTHWASTAIASSTYAEQAAEPALLPLRRIPLSR